MQESVRLRQEKPVRSEAEEEYRKQRKGAGKGAAALVPASAPVGREATARTALQCTSAERPGVSVCVRTRLTQPVNVNSADSGVLVVGLDSRGKVAQLADRVEAIILSDSDRHESWKSGNSFLE